MSDFDLSKITGNEPPYVADDDKDAEIAALNARLAEKEMDSFALNAVRNALNRGASIRSRDLSKPVLTKIDERTIYGGLDINLPPEKPCLEGVFFYHLQEQRGESSAIDAARAADSAYEVPCRHEWYHGACVHCLRWSPHGAADSAGAQK